MCVLSVKNKLLHSSNWTKCVARRAPSKQNNKFEISGRCVWRFRFVTGSKEAHQNGLLSFIKFLRFYWFASLERKFTCFPDLPIISDDDHASVKTRRGQISQAPLNDQPRGVSFEHLDSIFHSSPMNYSTSCTRPRKLTSSKVAF